MVAKLEKLTPKQSGAILRNAARAGATVFAQAVRSEAPVAAQPPTQKSTALPVGYLKSDVAVHISAKDGAYIATVTPGKFSKHVALFVEGGHRIVRGGYSSLNRKSGKARGPGKSYGTSKANPFVDRAFNDSVSAALAATQTAILDGLKKAGVAD